jgi:hypothetical protein
MIADCGLRIAEWIMDGMIFINRSLSMKYKR